MSITDKIGSFDFWGMLIPGCTTLWGVRIIYECNALHAYYSNWHAMPWMHNDLFKWSVFLVAGYIVGLAISITMDCIWEKFGWRNNPKSILKALDVQKKRNPVLYTPQIFNDMKTDAVITYYKMYNEVDAKYQNNPISTLERQVAFMRNIIIPFVILIIACLLQDEKIVAVLPGIMIVGIICLMIVRQSKIYQVVLEYYATLPQNMENIVPESKTETIMNTNQDVVKAEEKTDIKQKFKDMWYNIIQHVGRNIIYYMIALIILIGGIMFLAIYLPKVQNTISGNSADWGNFGAFFWGFGTMCFTLFNVIVFYIISQRLYRKQFYDTYRKALEDVIKNVVDENRRSNETSHKNLSKMTRISLINIIGVLGGINNVIAFSASVRYRAKQLVDECNRFSRESDLSQSLDLIGDLYAFQICLIANKHEEDKK